jgi:hypothetical protein
MEEWFYLVEGAEHGPVSADELKKLMAKGLVAETAFVCKQGMAKWITAREFSDFQQKKTVEANPVFIRQHKSILRLLWASWTIGRLKVARRKLASIKLPKARLSLGVAAYKQRLFEEEYAEVYQRIDTIVRQMEEAKHNPTVQASNTLSQDLARQLTKGKSKVNSVLLRDEFQTSVIAFGERLQKEHGNCEQLTSLLKAIDSISKAIRNHDQQIQDYCDGASFLFRHPSLLFGSISAVVVVIVIMWSETAYHRQVAKGYEDAHAAAIRTEQVLQDNQTKLARNQQRIQQDRLIAEQKLNEMRSNTAAHEIEVNSERTAVNEMALQKKADAEEQAEQLAREKRANDEQEQKKLADYAAKSFSGFVFSPTLLADQALGRCSITVEGERYDVIQNYLAHTDWLGLISFLNPHRRMMRTGRTRDYSQRATERSGNITGLSQPRLEKYPPAAAIDEAVDELQRSEFTVFISPSFIPGKPVFFILFDDQGYLPLELAKTASRHPTKPGWIVTCPCRINTLIALSASDSSSIEREIRPFNDYFNQQRKSLLKQQELGEISETICNARLAQNRGTVFERFKNYLMTPH